MSNQTKFFSNFNADFAAGLVVFLVALPLCLGIAMASGAPLFSGIISGVIGGILVGYLSQSHISVSGPAAGLTAIILTTISDLGAFDAFLLSVCIAGITQILLGYLKSGSIANYFPNNVIEGMLSGIGIIIILKQIPHAVGYDADYEGDLNFKQPDGATTFSSLFDIFNQLHLGAIIITIASFLVLILWEKSAFLKKIKAIPAALIAVIISILINEIFKVYMPELIIKREHLVSLPTPSTFAEFKNIFITPDFSNITNPKIWMTGLTIAIVASIETLLCIEAADRMDVQKRYTNPNTELKAQGIGNLISGLLGGLPMTSVVVRTSANNNAGAKTKWATIIHGLLLLICAIAIPTILNQIPLATLATILILVGYKLAKPATFMHFWKNGKYQFIPFIATLLGVVFTDLLKGVGIGFAISIFAILRGNLKRAYSFKKEEYTDGDIIYIDLAQEVSFLNKAAIKATLFKIPENAKVIIDAKDTEYIAHDILDLINEFKEIRSKDLNIKVKLRNFKQEYNIENTDSGNHVSVERTYDFNKRKIITKEVF